MVLRAPSSRSRSRIAAGSFFTSRNFATISRAIFSSSTCSVRNHCSSVISANAFSVKQSSYSELIWTVTRCSCSSAFSKTAASDSNATPGRSIAFSSTLPSRASTKSNSFMPCCRSSSLCSRSHLAAPRNFWRSQNPAIAKYVYDASNSELICSLMALSTVAFTETSPIAAGPHPAAYGRSLVRSRRSLQRLSDPPAIYWPAVEELLGHHDTVLLEDFAVLHHELHTLERRDVVQRIPGNGDDVGEVCRLDGTARLLGLAHLVAVDRHRAQDVGVRDARILPRLQKLHAHLAARLAGDVVVGVGRKRQRDFLGVRVFEACHGALIRLRRDRMSSERVGRVGPGPPDALLRHQRVHVLVEAGRMGDRPDARFDRVLRAVERLHVSFDLHPDLRRLADEQPNLVGGVAVRLAVDADLDHARAEQHVLTHRFDDLVVRVGVEVLWIDDVVLLGHLGRREELPAHAADDDPRVDDRRPRDPALLDRLPQRRVGVQGVVAHVANDRESRRQHLDPIRGRLNRAQRRRFLNVRVVVDV